MTQIELLGWVGTLVLSAMGSVVVVLCAILIIFLIVGFIQFLRSQ